MVGIKLFISTLAIHYSSHIESNIPKGEVYLFFCNILRKSVLIKILIISLLYLDSANIVSILKAI